MKKLTLCVVLVLLLSGCTISSASPTKTPTAKADSVADESYQKDLSLKLIELQIAYSNFSELMKSVHADPSLIENPDTRIEIDNALEGLNFVADRLVNIQGVSQNQVALDEKVDNLANSIFELTESYHSWMENQIDKKYDAFINILTNVGILIEEIMKEI